MEATNVSLINKLRQKYLNTLQIGEKNSTGGFIFSGDTIGADGSGGTWTYTGKYKSFKIDELEKIIGQFKAYIDKNGVDDKFLQEFSDEYKNMQYPNTVVESVVKYICELNKPEYILKLLELERCFWRIAFWENVIIESNNPEYIRLAIEKFVNHKSEYEYFDFNDKHLCEKIYKITYKKLKKAYRQAVKSNKAGI